MSKLKSGFLYKIVTTLVLVQMVLAPISPVLAEEIKGEIVPVLPIVPVSVVEPVVLPILEPLLPEVQKVVEEPVGVVVEPKVVEPKVKEEVASSTDIVVEDTTKLKVESKKPIKTDYVSLMRQMRGLDKNVKKADAIAELDNFIAQEKEKLDKMGVANDKQDKYFTLLRKQSILPDDKKANKDIIKEVKIPAKPSVFNFNKEEVQVEKLGANQGGSDLIKNALNSWVLIDRVGAMEDQYLPAVEDVKADGGEVIINSEIINLAKELNNNPVKIFNFVRDNITYEPYYGAKKGNIGCLKERVCNDVDASSLLISLYRASGIPARYKKSIAVMSVDQIKSLLGVEDAKTAYALWFWNKVPVHVLSDLDVSGGFENVDFSNETSLAVEWVFVEAFYPYDQRGANINNTIDFSQYSTTAELRTAIQNLSDYKRQWVPVDGVVKKYTHNQKEIVQETANMNVSNFWNNYLQYQGTLTPLEKYRGELLNTTGKDIFTTNYQSTRVASDKSLSILPPSLPYYTRTGIVGGSLIEPEAWSVLPEARRIQVRVSLLKDSDNSVVLERTFPSSAINGVEADLNYEGATEQDKQVIDSYGGIASTPATLVSIKPYLEMNGVKNETDVTLAIGDALIMQFDYILNNNTRYTDQKFSVAGNQEGIFVTLSQAQNDPSLDTNSKMLLAGNSALARAYVSHLSDTGSALSKSLDHGFNLNFARAVVTQNRVLSMVDGTPTTFDFKGLTVDASAYINDWSNRGQYKTHNKDFQLLWGLDASYYEGRLFEDIAGLEGISTVKGLQYAYANPGTYTVQTITTANEAVIDTLQFSNNTKANMHSDVQAGRTIVTPDKNVTKGNWNGVLYISLTADGLGTYAIGEQAQQNGGWTVNQYTLADWDDEDAKHQFVYQYNNGPQQFVYKDDSKKNILCSIKTQTYNQIVGGNIAPGWSLAKYGKPCMNDNENGAYMFGNHDHSLIVATDGAYFKSQSDGYDYWINNTAITNSFRQKFPNEGIAMGKLIVYWGTYRFNGSTAFSYKQAMFSPARQQAYFLDKNVGPRYFSDTKYYGEYMPDLMGFPLMDSAPAATYQPKNTAGTYQQFTYGTFYHNNLNAVPLFAVITFGPLNDRINEAGGSGVVGFPMSDPKERNGYRYQLLQSDSDVMWKLSDNSSAISPHIPYNCTVFGDYGDRWFEAPLMTATQLHGIFDSGIALIQDTETLLKSGLEFAMYNPTVLINLTNPTSLTNFKILEGYLGQIDYPGIVTSLQNSPTQISQSLIVEYNTSFGKRGCQARQWYLEGRLAGEFLQIYLPAKTLSLSEKLKVLKWAGETPAGVKSVAFTEKWNQYRNTLKLTSESLEVSGKFTKEKIYQMLSGQFNEVTSKFQGQGLHSARTLKTGMDSGMLEVWDKNEKIKYFKYGDIPVNASGVREVVIRKTTGLSNIKTIFPERWTDADIVDAVVQASRNVTNIELREFSGTITKNGVTLKIKGHLEPNLTEILDGYVDTQ